MAKGTYPQLVSSIFDGTCKLAIPKSAILIFKFLSNNKFSGFKSRWLLIEKKKKKKKN